MLAFAVICPCIANTCIFAEYIQQDATFHSFFISVRRSTCFRRFFRPSSGARLAVGSSNGLTYTRRCMCSFELLTIGRKNRLKHVEHLTEINKLWIVASCWLYSANSVLASACRGEVGRPRVSTGLSTLTKKWPPGTLQVYRADDRRFPFRLPLVTTFVVSRDETRTFFTPAASSRFRLEKLIVVYVRTFLALRSTKFLYRARKLHIMSHLSPFRDWLPALLWSLLTL